MATKTALADRAILELAIKCAFMASADLGLHLVQSTEVQVVSRQSLTKRSIHLKRLGSKSEELSY